MTDSKQPHNTIRTTSELGELVREHRKQKGLTLESASGLANLSVRFLSEFERGKETAEVGKVLKILTTLGLDVIVQPRSVSIASAADAFDTAASSQAKRIDD